MAEEILIPKMKRLDGKQGNIKLPINNLILVILCTLLIIGSTFVNIDIKHYIIPQGFHFGGDFKYEDFVYCFSIIPQVPILMFICSILGKKLATTCVCLYIILGLFAIPIFGLGGGISYITEYSFGYILAYIPATIIVGQILKKRYSFINLILASICGVLIIHILGILYMLLVALIRQDGRLFIHGWIVAQSGIKIIYDIILSFIMMLIGKYINAFFKFLSD